MLVAHVLDKEFKQFKIASELAKSPFGTRSEARNIELENSTIAEKVELGTELDGDGVLMGSGGRLHHIGLLCVIDDGKYVLHTTNRTGSILQTLAQIRSRYTIEGFYSWLD